jgi:hypothetical protein
VRSAHTQETSREEWYRLAGRFKDFGFRQAWDFNQQCAEQQSTDVEHIKVIDGTDVVGLAAVRIKRVPVLGTGVAYIGGGPLTRLGEVEDLDRLAVCLRALQSEYVRNRKLTLRVSAPLARPELREAVESVYAACGFVPAPSAAVYRTMVMDLSPSLEEIRKSLSKRWLRQLKKSEKVSFEVQIGTDPALFDEFCVLFETFVEWKDFQVEHGPRFHSRVHSALPEEARYLILLSRHEGQLAYGLVLAITGDTAVYVLGASNPALRDLRAGHYLHWQGIEELKKHGIRWYDLGGIDPEANPGVHEFKAGMTDVDITAPGPFECAPDQVRGLLVAVAERSYKRWQDLRRHRLHFRRR